MPELPEVEVVRSKLAKDWLGRTIERVWVSAPSYFFLTPPETLKKKLAKREIESLERRGKYIFAHFSGGSRLLIHLGMTGQVTMTKLARDEHVHMQWFLSGGGIVTFRDVRKFGKVEWLARGEHSERESVLGPDALDVDLATFSQHLENRRVAIKQALLDQSVLAGVGNIYADEALFRAKLDPRRRANALSIEEKKKLLAEIKKILRTSIERGGSTVNDYLHPDGMLGGYQNFHRVYGKEGEKCPVCRATIERVVLGGRSTHFCPRCQR